MTNEPEYLEENPFPYTGAFSYAPGRPLGKQTGTLPRHCIARLKEELQTFIDEFRPEWTAAGGVIVLRGPTGSGKTHTVCAALGGIAADLGDSAEISVYTIQQNESFFQCYDQVAKILRERPELLRKAARGLLGAMAARQVGDNLRQSAKDQHLEPEASERLAAAVSHELAGPLRRDPDKAEKLLSSYVAERSATESLQESVLLGLTQDRFGQNLKLAVEALQGKKYDQAAMKWFCLEPVMAEELSAMGISGPIQSAEDATAALRVLAGLFTMSGQPFILAIDQFEKLVPETEQVIAHRNAGYLRSLVEGFTRTNALLVLTGTDDGWGRLPIDLRERVGKRIIDCPRLELEEAEDLIRVYLTPAMKGLETRKRDLFPFDRGAVRAMLSVGGGNPRKLLQICHVLVRAAKGGKITDGSVKELARHDPPIYFDREAARRETRKMLTLQSMPFQEYEMVQGLRFDFIVNDGAGNVAMLIDVKEAFFRDDEAASAYVYANKANKLRGLGIQAPVFLIAAGYVSPEVNKLLADTGVVDTLIVYSPDTYAAELRAIIEDLRRRAPAIRPPDPDVTSKLDKLIALNLTRTEQTAVFDKRSLDLGEQQARERYEKRFETARSDWSKLRRDLEKSITDARQARRNTGLLQLNQQIRSALWTLVARDVLLAIVAAFTALAPAVLPDPGWKPIVIAYTRFVAAGCAGWLVMDLFSIVMRPRWWQRLGSAAELDLIAAEPLPYIFLRFLWMNPLVMNPFVRLQSYPRRDPERVFAEPLALIREAALRSSGDIRLTRMAWRVAETLLLCEPPARKVTFETPPPLKVLQDIKLISVLAKTSNMNLSRDDDAGSKNTSSRPQVSFIQQLAGEFAAQEGTWYGAFDEGLDRTDLRKLPFVSERQMREAVQELSPLAEGGLGTYDFLDSVALVDQMFLFCSQYLFYTERDVLRGPS